MPRKQKAAPPPASIDLAKPDDRAGWVNVMRLWGTLKGRASPQDPSLPPAGFVPDKGIGKTVWLLGVNPEVGWKRIAGRLLAAVEANNSGTGPMAPHIAFVRDRAGYEMLLRQGGATLLPQVDAAIEQRELDQQAGVVERVQPVGGSATSRAFALALGQLDLGDNGFGFPMLGGGET